MTKKLHGMLNLSRIPSELIMKNQKGDSIVWVDVIELREKDKYGNTHTMSIYDKAAKKAVYIANFKWAEFASNASESKNDGLPF